MTGMAWGRMLAAWYDVVRQPSQAELNYWEQAAQRHERIVEIGAGQGHLSIALARARPQVLTLFEPELENLPYLRRRLTGYSFELVTGELGQDSTRGNDLAVLGYDTLPMIQRDGQGALFRHVARSIRVGARFHVHLYPPSKLMNRSPLPSLRRMNLGDLGVVEVSSKTVQHGPNMYVKRIDLRSEVLGAGEEYEFETWVVTDEDVMELARQSGLTLDRLAPSYGQDGGSNLGAVYEFVRAT
ncbi:hypothetical protein [Archangium violaceum]|uniref:hypothetical protein n=1 Tax=Archangium violaceum TaxID=83451 RepID=UPI0036D7C1A6